MGKNETDLKQKTGLILAYIMQTLILIFIFIAIYKKEYFIVVGAAISLIITFLPAIIKRKLEISLPWTLNFLIVLSLYLHNAGISLNFYPTFYPFYDKFGHFIGSVTVALLGFASVIIVDRYSKLKLTKKHILFFIVIFTIALGALWEIGEFAMDKLFGQSNQYSLDDTMYDLIFDALGGLFVAFITHINFETMKQKITFGE